MPQSENEDLAFAQRLEDTKEQGSIFPLGQWEDPKSCDWGFCAEVRVCTAHSHIFYVHITLMYAQIPIHGTLYLPIHRKTYLSTLYTDIGWVLPFSDYTHAHNSKYSPEAHTLHRFVHTRYHAEVTTPLLLPMPIGPVHTPNLLPHPYPCHSSTSAFADSSRFLITPFPGVGNFSSGF